MGTDTYTRCLVLAAGLLSLGAIAAGLLAFGGRFTVPRGERAALGEGPAALARVESAAPAGRPGGEDLWRAYLDVFDKEIGKGHRDVAIRVLYDAYGAALESRSWQSMIAVGDAFMAVGTGPGNAAGAQMNARQSYLTALIRARRQRSVEGALRSAEAFRRLSDRDVVEQCLHIAEMLAAGDAEAQQRVREAQGRWATRQPMTEL